MNTLVFGTVVRLRRVAGTGIIMSLLFIVLFPLQSSAVEEGFDTAVLDDELVVIEESARVNEREIENLTGNDFADTYRKEQLPVSDLFTDFVVGPGRFEMELAPGQSRTVELVITNRMGERKLFSFDFEDAEGSQTGESAVSLLGDRTGPYTIRDFISVPHENFYLNNGERARVPVTISLPADAEPGGRYGSILTSVTSNPGDADQEGGAQPASAVISRIGTLFFVTTPGDIVRESSLRDFSTLNKQRFFTAGPITFNVLQENTGSIHTTPYGRITVTNILGEEVGASIIEPWFVMPNSLRTREIKWDRDLLIGRYVATAEINRGYNDVIDVATYSFWVIPWKLALGAFVAFFTFFMLLRFLFTRFEFKRK